jgi:predicted transcriptional regulator
MADMPEHISTIHAMRTDGRTDAAIAEHLGVTRRAVQSVSARWSAINPDSRVAPAVSPHAASKALRARIVQLRQKGYANREIAAILDVPTPTVGRHVAKARADGALPRFEPKKVRESAYTRWAALQREGGPRRGSYQPTLGQYPPDVADRLQDLMRPDDATLMDALVRIALDDHDTR